MIQAEFHRSDSDFGLLIERVFHRVLHVHGAVHGAAGGPLLAQDRSSLLAPSVWSIATLLTAVTYNFKIAVPPAHDCGNRRSQFRHDFTHLCCRPFRGEDARARAGRFLSGDAGGHGARVYLLGGTVSAHYNGWRSPFYMGAAPGFLLASLSLFLPGAEAGTVRFSSGNCPSGERFWAGAQSRLSGRRRWAWRR